MPDVVIRDADAPPHLLMQTLHRHLLMQTLHRHLLMQTLHGDDYWNGHYYDDSFSRHDHYYCDWMKTYVNYPNDFLHRGYCRCCCGYCRCCAIVVAAVAIVVAAAMTIAGQGCYLCPPEKILPVLLMGPPEPEGVMG